MRPFNNILVDWQTWPVADQPCLVRQFTDGLNHDTALLRVGQKELVLKRFLSEPARQIEAQLWAASLGIAPQVWFYPPDKEYMLMEALIGDHINIQGINDVALYAIAQGLTLMHRAVPGPSSVEGFDIRKFCESYLDHTDAKIVKRHEELIPILDIFYNDSTPWTFCHNDLVAANCFLQGNIAQFIDWEYADTHNPWFDLAAIIVYFGLDRKQTEFFISCYDQTLVEKINQPIFYASQIALLWGDMLWHLNKFGGEHWQKLNLKNKTLNKLVKKYNLLAT